MCDDQELCQGCNEPRIIESRVTEDVLQAMIAAVLSYNVWALNDIIDLYALEYRTANVYINGVLVARALEFIMGVCAVICALMLWWR